MRGNPDNSSHRFLPKFKENLLNSNRFGRWKQSIVVRVAASKAATFAQRLASVSEISSPDPSTAVMTWTRYSVRRGDDENVVIELWRAIDGFAESCDWEIDWKASDY